MVNMDNDQESPRFPPELEHKIFELCLSFHLHEEIAPVNLLLVAKRVTQWLTPLCYDVVMAHPTAPSPRIATTENIKKYGHHVHHFQTSLSSMNSLLSVCPNISNLAIWAHASKDLLDVIIHLPITRLSIDIGNLLRVRSRADLQTFLSRITHLDVSSRVTWAEEKVLSQFLVLTHVAMYGDIVGLEVGACLKYVKMLKAIVLVSTGSEEDGLEEVLTDREDPRIVGIRFGGTRTFRGDWKEGAYGGEDMWAFADDVMDKRQRARLEEGS
ncbi:hypothetical protein BDN72DRAFT_956198 [Pluteus cervinus]|uniref:Uncharacterized protein n=1 Tax=Pluteus cervinus TaxID=181527 RepID=A0ACD3B705_9AGAR|nr:hypothetical protein BDN72DRAFT_956198 [Pluteus cervinus]